MLKVNNRLNSLSMPSINATIRESLKHSNPARLSALIARAHAGNTAVLSIWKSRAGYARVCLLVATLARGKLTTRHLRVRGVTKPNQPNQATKRDNLLRYFFSVTINLTFLLPTLAFSLYLSLMKTCSRETYRLGSCDAPCPPSLSISTNCSLSCNGR